METNNGNGLLQNETNDLNSATKMEEVKPEESAPRKTKKRKKVSDAVRYHCNYCGKDISNVIRVKCAVCPDFDLCVQCFSVGVEIGNHKSNHDYHIMDILNFPLFEEDWGADEELLLLEGIEMYGLGNWGDVSDHIGTKTYQQAKEHYFKIYINIPTAPLPDMSKILTTAESLQQRHSANHDADAQQNDEEDISVDDHDQKEEANAKPQNASKTIRKNETYQKTSAGFSFPELAGYMPLRGDFETEHENDAELILMDMAFTEEDTQVEKELKLRILEIYNRKLDERIFRKNFIKERNLFDKKERRKNKELAKELYERIRVFARVITKEENEQFINGLIAERNLRKRIEELKEYRRHGFHTLEEARAFEQDFGSISAQKKRKDLQEPYSASSPLLSLRKSTSSALERSHMLSSSRSNRYMTRDNSILSDLKIREKVPKPKANRKPGSPLDISGSPGYELLSEREREFCANIRLFPQQYTLIKDTLIQNYLKLGYLKKGTARQLVKIDVNKTGRIFDFFEESGWINTTKHSPKISESDSRTLPPITNANGVFVKD